MKKTSFAKNCVPVIGIADNRLNALRHSLRRCRGYFGLSGGSVPFGRHAKFLSVSAEQYGGNRNKGNQ